MLSSAGGSASLCADQELLQVNKKDRKMKVYSMEIQTDLGRRVVQLAAPLDVDPTGDMPAHFRSLTEVLWGVLCEIAEKDLVLTTPNAEA